MVTMFFKTSSLILIFISSIFFQSNVNECHKPGANKNVKNAIEQMHLEYRYGIENKNQNTNSPSILCQKEYFSSLSNGKLKITSDGHKKNRTELKQNRNYPNSLNKNSKIVFAGKISNVPHSKIESEYEDGIIIAQIHNRGFDVKTPLIKVVVSENSKKIMTIFSDGYLKSDSKKQINCLKFNNNDHIEVTLEITGNQNTINVILKNTTQKTKFQDKFKIPSTSNWLEFKNQFYYKTGIYQQISGSKPSIEYDYIKLK